MYFSGKISNSVLKFIDLNGSRIEDLSSRLPVPEEFLRDPSTWVPAADMEDFLSLIEPQLERLSTSSDDFGFSVVGHNCVELRAWGVLDGVLRLLKSPWDIYGQPERFISYFISPPPMVTKKSGSQEKGFIEFEIPIDANSYPCVVRYLTSAFEALPLYLSRELGKVSWSGTTIRFDYFDHQKSLFKDEVKDEKSLKPNLLESLVESLEYHQKELESKNRQLIEKNQELETAKMELQKLIDLKVSKGQLESLSQVALGLSHEVNNPLTNAQGNVSRLKDYFIRAQQLVTLLIGQDRMSKQVKMAMHKTDWEFISNEYPKIVCEVQSSLKSAQESMTRFSNLVDDDCVEIENIVSTDINHILERVVNTLKQNSKKSVKFEKIFLLDRKIELLPGKFENAIEAILKHSLNSSRENGAIRIVSRPKGRMAQIEVTDNGTGYSATTIEELLTKGSLEIGGPSSSMDLSVAKSMVNLQNGKLDFKSELGKGSTYIIEFPM